MFILFLIFSWFLKKNDYKIDRIYQDKVGSYQKIYWLYISIEALCLDPTL